MIHVVTPEGNPINRDTFNRSKTLNALKGEGLGSFSNVNAMRIDRVLTQFIKRPGVELLNFSEEAQEYFDRAKGP